MRNKVKSPQNNAATLKLFGNSQVWSTELAFEALQKLGEAGTKRTAERRLHELDLWPSELTPPLLRDEFKHPLNSLLLNKQLEVARSKRKLILFIQLHTLANGETFLHVNSAKGGRHWISVKKKLSTDAIIDSIRKLQAFIGKPILLFPHGLLTAYFRGEQSHLKAHPLTAYREPVPSFTHHRQKKLSLPPHLARLEAESIFIFREAVAHAKNPVMMYSIGKDSSVMLELAKKAFYPGKLPFPLLHVDTRWKFQAMYDMRNEMVKDPNINLIIHTNPVAIEKNINPFDHGSAVHTDITKTEGLKQALDQYQFDAIFGGARRDEEKSRAKERLFSFRTASHHWDPKNQRPELWSLFNTRINPGESMRIFPLSNWTELDIWEYIYYQNIPVVPLYFAKQRPIVDRGNLLLMVDDERFQLKENEQVKDQLVRFRTLGCYPLTGAIESTATNIPEIILELIGARQTERQGRAIDSDANASMEKKKQEGYF